MAAQPESRALTVPLPAAPLATGARVSPIVPTNVFELAEVANHVVKAGLAPSSYEVPGKPDETRARIIIGIMRGAEVGFPPITALSTIFIVNNRPCLWGDAAMALCQSKGLIERVETSWEGTLAPTKGEPIPNDFADDYACVFKIWRRGQKDPFVGRFSVRDAKRAHLWGRKQTWVQYPTRMLLARARAFAFRDGFADALMGLAIAEEVQDLPVETAVTDTSFLDDDPAALVLEHQPAASIAAIAADHGLPDRSLPEPAPAAPAADAASPGPDPVVPAPTDDAGPGEIAATADRSADRSAEMTAWGARAIRAIHEAPDVIALERIERFVRRDLGTYALCFGREKAEAFEEMIAIKRRDLAG